MGTATLTLISTRLLAISPASPGWLSVETAYTTLLTGLYILPFVPPDPVAPLRLAIGAAFAAGYMSGLSTSVAVLCHELPHEIGDFAMLIKAGMTIKQAIFYNVLSSILAMVGMVFGLLVAASLPQVTPWLFSATAGIFLYVALVDMMPELSSGHAHPISRDRQREPRGLALFLQVDFICCLISKTNFLNDIFRC